jgi:hypothetical protein
VSRCKKTGLAAISMYYKTSNHLALSDPTNKGRRIYNSLAVLAGLILLKMTGEQLKIPDTLNYL